MELVFLPAGNSSPKKPLWTVNHLPGFQKCRKVIAREGCSVVLFGVSRLQLRQRQEDHESLVFMAR